jgi:hypothetical protein
MGLRVGSAREGCGAGAHHRAVAGFLLVEVGGVPGGGVAADVAEVLVGLLAHLVRRFLVVAVGLHEAPRLLAARALQLLADRAVVGLLILDLESDRVVAPTDGAGDDEACADDAIVEDRVRAGDGDI